MFLFPRGKKKTLRLQRIKDNNNNNNMATSGDHMRRKAVGFEAFAKGKKGVTRAIKEARVRKERTTRDKAILLKGYKKVMKQEGLEPGRGAGRKRARDDEEKQEENDEEQAQENKKRKRFDPMSKTLQKIADRQKEKEEFHIAQEEKKKEQTQKDKERRQRTQVLKKRTRKGQPIMKNVIGGLLSKLEKNGK